MALVFLLAVIPFRAEAVPITAPEIALIIENSTVIPDAQPHKIGYLLFDNHRPLIALPNITDFSFIISENLNYFNWTFSNSTSVIGDETRIINISTTLPISFPDSTFSRELFLRYATIDSNGTYQNKSFAFNVTVPKYRNYTIYSSNYSPELSVGSNGVLANITLKNIGNVDLSLAASISNCSYMTVPKTIPLYRMIEQTIAVQFDILRSEPIGNITCNITLAGEGIASSIIPFNISLSDKLVPEIKNVTVNDTMATLDNDFSVTIKDNLGIKAVWFVYKDGNIINATLKEDSNTYQIHFNGITDLQTINYIIYAEDTNGNIASQNGTFKIIELDSLKINKTIDFGKIHYGATTEGKVFLNMLYETPVTIGFSDIKYDCGSIMNESIETKQINASWWERNLWGAKDQLISAKKEMITPINCTWKVIITNPNGEKKYFDYTNINKTITLVGEGFYTIAVSGEQLGSLYGTMYFQTIPQHKVVPNMTVISEFVSYEVPILHLNDTYSWGTRECNYLDEGTFESSRTICLETHFCEKGACDARRLGATMSPEEKESMTTLYENRIYEKDRQISSQSIRLYLVFFAFIITSIYVIYQKYVHPYLTE